jgi:lauroyl/myristoyl acyltransferase
LDRLKRDFVDVAEYSGLEYLEEARRKGGVILVTAHFGAIEYLPMAMTLKQYPVSIVMKFQTEKLKQSLLERAEQNNVELIDGNECDPIRKQLNALKRGAILLTECDEVDSWNTRLDATMPAFGGRIYVDRTIAFLARHAGAEVLGAFLMRTERGYRLIIEPIGQPEGNDEDLARKIMMSFERIVMSAPDQWYHWKKFHKMRPETV